MHLHRHKLYAEWTSPAILVVDVRFMFPFDFVFNVLIFVVLVPLRRNDGDGLFVDLTARFVYSAYNLCRCRRIVGALGTHTHTLNVCRTLPHQRTTRSLCNCTLSIN
jgi:hypothetical protein